MQSRLARYGRRESPKLDLSSEPKHEHPQDQDAYGLHQLAYKYMGARTLLVFVCQQGKAGRMQRMKTRGLDESCLIGKAGICLEAGVICHRMFPALPYFIRLCKLHVAGEPRATSGVCQERWMAWMMMLVVVTERPESVPAKAKSI